MKKRTLFLIIQWCAIAAAVAAGAVQTWAMLTAYGADKNYFVTGTPLPTVAAILALLAGALGILSAALTDKTRLSSPVIDSVLPSIPAACGLAYGAFLLLTGSSLPLRIPTALTMLGAALYALLLTAGNARRFPRALACLGFLAVAACAMINVYCYFDSTLEMNAPVKVTVQTGLLFAMLYYTAELRFLLGREKPRLYVALSLCSVAALSLPAVSIYAAHNGGILSRTDYFAFGIVSLGVLASILLRVLCYTGALGREETEVTEADAESTEGSDGDFGEEFGEKPDGDPAEDPDGDLDASLEEGFGADTDEEYDEEKESEEE